MWRDDTAKAGGCPDRIRVVPARRESPIRTRSRDRKGLTRRARARPGLRAHLPSTAIANATGDCRSRFGPKMHERFTVSTTRPSCAASPIRPAHGSQPGAQAGRHARRGRGDSGRTACAPNGTQWHQLATSTKGSVAQTGLHNRLRANHEERRRTSVNGPTETVMASSNSERNKKCAQPLHIQYTPYCGFR